VDSTFVTSFEDLLQSFRHAGVLFVISNPNSTVLHRLHVTGLHEAMSTQFGDDREWIFLTVSDAVEAVRNYEPPLKPVKLRDGEWEVRSFA
jgi:hypothetical protein